LNGDREKAKMRRQGQSGSLAQTYCFQTPESKQKRLSLVEKNTGLPLWKGQENICSCQSVRKQKEGPWDIRDLQITPVNLYQTHFKNQASFPLNSENLNSRQIKETRSPLFERREMEYDQWFNGLSEAVSLEGFKIEESDEAERRDSFATPCKNKRALRMDLSKKEKLNFKKRLARIY
jgi:hypothetical protein